MARSPLTQATGTPYDDAWRAINRLLVEHSVAGHQRNVFLRNDGQGRLRRRLGRASGSTWTRTGGPSPCSTTTATATRTSSLLAPRSAPQLRLFRNDFAERGATLAVAPDRDARATATRWARA